MPRAARLGGPFLMSAIPAIGPALDADSVVPSNLPQDDRIGDLVVVRQQERLRDDDGKRLVALERQPDAVEVVLVARARDDADVASAARAGARSEMYPVFMARAADDQMAIVQAQPVGDLQARDDARE